MGGEVLSINMLIKSLNNLTTNATKTFLTNQEVAGTNVLRWKNPNGFGAQWAVQVGEIGEEQAEIVILGASAPSGTAGTLAANTLYEHPLDTPLYATKYDQIVFERSTTGTAGTAISITGGTLSITPDSQFTVFDDTSGSVSYAYKTYYRNSSLAVNSTESDWITSTGFSPYSLANMRQRARGKLWNSAFVIDQNLTDWINEWQESMANAAISVNEDYFINTGTVTFAGSAEYGTITASDFKQIRRVWYTQDGNNTYQMTKMELNTFFPNQGFSETHPFFFMKGDTVIGRRPNEVSGTITIDYYAFPAPMQNDTDNLSNSLRTYTKSFVDYCVAQSYAKDGKTTEYQMKMQEAEGERDRFKRESSPRNKTGPTYIQIVDDVGAGNTDWYF